MHEGSTVVDHLVLVVGAPAGHGAVGEQRIAVRGTGGDRGRVADPGDLDRDHAVGEGGVAQLTVGVVTPRPYGAVGTQRIAVFVARADATIFVSPATWTGANRSIVSPSPS